MLPTPVFPNRGFFSDSLFIFKDISYSFSSGYSWIVVKDGFVSDCFYSFWTRNVGV